MAEPIATPQPNLPPYLVPPTGASYGVGIVHLWVGEVLQDAHEPAPEDIHLVEIRHAKRSGPNLQHEALFFLLQVDSYQVWIAADRGSGRVQKPRADGAVPVSTSTASLQSTQSTTSDTNHSLAGRFGHMYHSVKSRSGSSIESSQDSLRWNWETNDRVRYCGLGSIDVLKVAVFGARLSEIEEVGKTAYALHSRPTLFQVALAFKSAATVMGSYDLINSNCYVFSAAVRHLLEQSMFSVEGTPDYGASAGHWFSDMMIDARKTMQTVYSEKLVTEFARLLESTKSSTKLLKEKDKLLKAKEEELEAKEEENKELRALLARANVQGGGGPSTSGPTTAALRSSRE